MLLNVFLEFQHSLGSNILFELDKLVFIALHGKLFRFSMLKTRSLKFIEAISFQILKNDA